MVRKFCPRCKSYSYSAACDKEWICPDCGHDLTKEAILGIREQTAGEDSGVEDLFTQATPSSRSYLARIK